ncbi:uncharacterized protein LOC132743537 [Ruditapes philippinarum]|uniref:uncharacterized protein LOC132743537 n=1 Tax=Ruditapes philippinarum TaxID=129788 RepID=UPI00295B9D07|nr:uncharacterized protein LOC132743537 [Ruditapes philippinarum]
MSSMSRILFFVQVCVLLFEVHANEVNVDCYPNNTVIVSNPAPASLHYGLASDSDAQCNLTFSSNYSLITLTGCSKNDTIVVQLADVEFTSVVIGGLDKVLVRIICQEIEQGLERNITQILGSSLVMEDIASVETSFQGFSSIRNNSATDPPMTAVRLSEPVFFTYDLYEGYVMRFLQCTAYPGKDTTEFNISHKLIENDCTVDVNQMNSFAPNKIVIVDKHTRYYTELSMFRFWVSFYLTIACDVMICRADSSAPCDMATCANTRRRRETEDINDKDVQHVTTRSTFQVLDTLDYIIFPFGVSSASTSILVSGIPAVWMLVCLSMLRLCF